MKTKQESQTTPKENSNSIELEKTNKTEEEKNTKKQKTSISYTLRNFGKNIKKLHKAEAITAEEADTMNKIHEEAITRWIKNDLGI